MSRYFSRRPKADGWVEDDDDIWPNDLAKHIPSVSDHEAVDTGLLDIDGNCIMRAPNPVGFGKDDEW